MAAPLNHTRRMVLLYTAFITILVLGVALLAVGFFGGSGSRAGVRNLIYELMIPSGKTIRVEMSSMLPSMEVPPLKFVPGQTAPILKVRVAKAMVDGGWVTYSSSIGTEVARLKESDHNVGTRSVSTVDPGIEGISTFGHRGIQWRDQRGRFSIQETSAMIDRALAEIPQQDRVLILEFLLFRRDELEATANATQKLGLARRDETLWEKLKSMVSDGVDLSLMPVE